MHRRPGRAGRDAQSAILAFPPGESSRGPASDTAVAPESTARAIDTIGALDPTDPHYAHAVNGTPPIPHTPALTGRIVELRPLRDDDAPNLLDSQFDAMTLTQLLAGQQISMALTHQRHGSRTDIHRQFAIARLATPRRNKSGRSCSLVAPHQPADLTLTQLQPFSRLYDRQAVLDDRFDNLDALKLVHADRDESTSVHGLAPGWP